MASDNARHFELRLRKLGLFLLICSMACLLFVAFLFGVVVGNDLDTYPEKISRQMPIKFLEWTGVLAVAKAPPPVVVIRSTKAVAKEEKVVPQSIVPDVPPPSSPLTEADVDKGESRSLKQEKIKESPTALLPDKRKLVESPLITPKDKKPVAGKYVVHVTSCKSRKIAEDVVKKIGKIGFKTKIVTAELKDKGTWYRVLLSDLNSEDKANEAAEKIDRILKGNKSVVRVQKR